MKQPKWLTDALASGDATEGPRTNFAALTGEPDKKTKGVYQLVEPLCCQIADTLTLVIPLVTMGEANGRDWKARSRRSGAAWKAARGVARIDRLSRFESAIREGRPVSAHFVRLGGKGLDTMVNLPSALKGCEDAVAYLIGVDDRSPLWRPTCGQEPGARWGVRVELRTPPDDGPPDSRPSG
jgi:hypothetical protein